MTSALSDLKKRIQSIHDDKLSGVIMVTGAKREADTPITFSLRFESGQLSRINGAGQYQGKLAFVELCSMQQVGQLRWMPLNPSATWSGVAEMEFAEMAPMLGLAVSVSPQEITEDRQKITDAVARVHDVFSHFYLGDYVSDLGFIESQCSPYENFNGYMQLCIEHLTPFLGASEAAKLLKQS